MNVPSEARHPIEALAEEFAVRYRRGERPRVEEYVRQHPDLAEEIRELFPALEMMEELSPQQPSDRTLDALPGQPAALGRGQDDPTSQESSNAGEPGSAVEDARGPGGTEPTGELPLIGRFQVLRLIGQGGFGMVHEAVDPKLQRRVALKVPRLELPLTGAVLRRFVREAETAASLDHPNIVPVYEAGGTDGLFYIASAYVEGISLAQWFEERDRTLLPGEAAQLVRTLAEAVHHAHSRGVLHRDLKPANILIATSKSEVDSRNLQADLAVTASQIKITDFGLAKFIGDDSGDTHTDAILGTPSYMSPEQAEGRAREVGTAADIFALGAILYELLTGKAPFVRETSLATLHAIRFDEPARITRDVPRDLQAICWKCLEKKPANRYRTAAALSDDLMHFLRHEPILARPIGGLERLARWRRRNPALSSLAAAVLLLVMLLVAGSTTAALWLAQAQRSTLDSLEAEIRAKDKATRNEELALRALFAARLNEARASRHSGLPGSRADALNAVKKAAAYIERLKLGPDDILGLRNEAIGAMALLDLRLECQWPGHPPRNTVTRTGFDADVLRYAHLEPDGKIAVRRVADNAELLRLAGLGQPRKKPYVRFSEDGHFLAVRGVDGKSQLRLQLWDLRRPGAPILNELAASEWTDRNVDFTPDSQRLAFGGPNGTIQLYNLATRKLAPPIVLGWVPGWLRFSPDGQRLATVNGRGDQVLFVTLATGQQVGGHLDHPSTVNDAAWSPSGQLLATACDDTRVHVWDTVTEKELRSSSADRGAVLEVAFDPTGELLMSSGSGCTILWEPLSGRPLVRSMERGLRFSRDGCRLAMAVSGVTVGRWEVSPRREYFTLSGHVRRPYVEAVAYHPGGRLLASVAHVDGIRLWDMHTRREVAHLEFSGSSIAFAPDGNALYVGGRNRAFRLPIAVATREDGLELRLGVPEQICAEGWVNAYFIFSRDGKTLVTGVGDETVVVMDVDKKPKRRLEIKRKGSRFFDLSPDGQLVVVGNWGGSDCSVWNARNGEFIKTLSRSGSMRVRFSPDGRWLAANGFDECTLWDVKTWTPRFRLAHDGDSYSETAFSSDHRLLAVTTRRAVQLINLAGGREIAKLQPPDDLEARSICFSPDGRQLAVGTRGHTIRIWDLGAIREKLREIKADWDHPPLPAAAEKPLPLKIQLDPKTRGLLALPPPRTKPQAELERFSRMIAANPRDGGALWRRGKTHVLLGRWEEAVADCTRAIELAPGTHHPYYWRGRAYLSLSRFDESLADFRRSQALVANDSWCLRHMAWIRVGGPPKLRDARKALRLAERAVELSREMEVDNYPVCLAALGMAHYRLNEFETALATLDTAIKAGAVNSRIFLFKAMCHRQLGDRGNARLYYEEALYRIERETRDDGLGDPRYVRSEVETLLAR